MLSPVLNFLLLHNKKGPAALCTWDERDASNKKFPQTPKILESYSIRTTGRTNQNTDFSDSDAFIYFWIFHSDQIRSPSVLHWLFSNAFLRCRNLIFVCAALIIDMDPSALFTLKIHGTVLFNLIRRTWSSALPFAFIEYMILYFPISLVWRELLSIWLVGKFYNSKFSVAFYIELISSSVPIVWKNKNTVIFWHLNFKNCTLFVDKIALQL